MASLAGALFGPGGSAWGTAETTSTLALDASTDKIAVVCLAPASDTITHLWIRTTALTGTCPTYKVSLQGVTTGGAPDGTVLGGGSPASATFTVAGAERQWVALDNSYAVTLGDPIAIVVEYASGTINGSNFATFAYGSHGFIYRDRPDIPYAMANTGSWSKSASTGVIYGMRSSTARYGFPLVSATNEIVTTLGHRLALGFNIPAGAGSTFKIRGARFAGGAQAASTATYGLWTASTEVTSVDRDTDISSIGGSLGRHTNIPLAPTAIDHGTDYYVGIESDGGDVKVLVANFDDADDAASMPGGSMFWYATYNGSAWTDDDTKRPMIMLELDDWTEPSGGSDPFPSRGLHAIGEGICV